VLRLCRKQRPLCRRKFVPVVVPRE
jgi:hypothetical protein